MIAKNSKIFQLLAFLSVLFAFRCPRSEAGRGVAFLILARAERRRWLVLREFAKYAFFGLTRQNPVFERSVLKYVSIKNRILTPSGQKSRVCVNQPDRLYPTIKFPSAFPGARWILFSSKEDKAALREWLWHSTEKPPQSDAA